MVGYLLLRVVFFFFAADLDLDFEVFFLIAITCYSVLLVNPPPACQFLRRAPGHHAR
jgi:hypothetical protein